MRVAVYACTSMAELLKKNNDQSIIKVWDLIARQHPEHTFFFLLDPTENQQVFAENVAVIGVNSTSFSSKILSKWSQQWRILTLLRKLKADIVIFSDKLHIRHKNSIQILQYPTLNFRRNSEKRTIYGAEVKLIIAENIYLKENIIKKSNINADSVCIIQKPGMEKFKPIGWEEKENIKAAYSEGKEYFLYVGQIDCEEAIMQLLKAFSIFKKWQKSNMQLLICIKMLSPICDIEKKLQTYKYRSEVKLLYNLEVESLARITAAAYAFVYPDLLKGTELPFVETMQCAVPAILPIINDFSPQENPVALYATTASAESLATQMKIIYKDENLRNYLIDNIQTQLKSITWENTSNALWDCIEKNVLS